MGGDTGQVGMSKVTPYTPPPHPTPLPHPPYLHPTPSTLPPPYPSPLPPPCPPAPPPYPHPDPPPPLPLKVFHTTPNVIHVRNNEPGKMEVLFIFFFLSLSLTPILPICHTSHSSSI